MYGAVAFVGAGTISVALLFVNEPARFRMMLIAGCVLVAIAVALILGLVSDTFPDRPRSPEAHPTSRHAA
jgi:hypothetical protein